MIQPTVFADPMAVGAALADEIAGRIAAAATQGSRFALGCPGGRSPIPTYRALVEQVRRRDLDLRPLTIVMMDEYVEPAGTAYRPVPRTAHYSVVRFAAEHLIGPLNDAAGPGRSMAPDRLLFPDPADPGAYEDQLDRIGGVDLFILASGDSDGHVAFNPPGSGSDTQTRVIPLADSTRGDNLRTFPQFENLDQVPRFGISIGVGTIARVSRRAVMIATGTAKRIAVQRICSAEDYDPQWPATVLLRCRHASLYTDFAAMLVGPPAVALTHPQASP